MPRQYSYININDYYFCLQQNPAVLAWILFFRRDELIAVKPWLAKDFPLWRTTYFRHRWKLIKSDLNTIAFFLQCRLNLRKAEKVRLPVYGQFGVPVHKGYKIFNIFNGTATKIFDADVNILSVLGEIDQMRRASLIDFAPSLKSWDIDGKFYEEEYINGSVEISQRSLDSAVFLKTFCREVVPCISNLMAFEKPAQRDLKEYAGELITDLEVGISSMKASKANEVDMIMNFVHSMAENLHADGSRSVYLAFTHGDFCPANILRTKGGIKFIDWESAAYRSMLFDFYSYFFYRPVCLECDIDKMHSEINGALPALFSRLNSGMTDLPAHIADSADVYRKLYYLELICKLVERKSTDNRLDIMDYIRRYIGAFNNYEQYASREDAGICAA
ncbi:MAG: phosphotransferase [Nitrospirae bacterium]|nr:phosphotransferase [Nitrospirota bacterium]